MKVLVTGANGQLGSCLRLASGNSSHEFIFTDVAELDICDALRVRDFVVSNSVDAIVNCAGYTNVDAAEDDEALALRINADAAENLALAIKERDGLLIHISTDYVFGGEAHSSPISEDEEPAPLGAYGRSKLLGERKVAASGCKYVILRTAWLFSEFGKNFVKTMLRLTSERPQIQVVCDQNGTPTYAGDLAAVILTILDDYSANSAAYPRTGIYNYTDEGSCSWYEFACAIAEEAGNLSCDIRPCRTDEYPSKARRPAYSVLDKSKIKNTFGIAIPHWTTALKTCLEK